MAIGDAKARNTLSDQLDRVQGGLSCHVQQPLSPSEAMPPCDHPPETPSFGGRRRGTADDFTQGRSTSLSVAAWTGADAPYAGQTSRRRIPASRFANTATQRG